MRPNPYRQVDSEGYLINPNNGSNVWYHYTGDADLRAFNMRDFEVTESNITPTVQCQETYFAGHWAPYEARGRSKLILDVRIRLGADCCIFDARELFHQVPSWVIDDITRAFNEMDDVHEPQQVLDVEHEEGAASQETLDYLNNGDLGETLNLWRKTHDSNLEHWADWLIWLWMLDFGVVLSVLSQPEKYPIPESQTISRIVGWFEREMCDALHPKWNAISVAIAHNACSRVPYIHVPCLDETMIEIISIEKAL